MRIVSVGLMESEAANVVVLQEKGGNRVLVISIGLAEATAIALPVEGIEPPRPLTHDLVMTLLQRLQARITSVVIHDLRDDTYIGQIDLETENGVMEIDARSSDAIALAVRARAPIYVTESVLEAAALTAEEDHWVR
ncbi:MAG TPA: bifunctional nuclease family protein [Sphingobacteriaceae bacterium]|nr:bifunctional nuclease family protein [Sphingobacteriaceae bacterium]